MFALVNALPWRYDERMYERQWLQSGDSLVESRLLTVVLDRVATRARHQWRTPATMAIGETAFRDLTVGRAPTALGRLIEDGAELLDQAVAAHRSSGRAAARGCGGWPPSPGTARPAPSTAPRVRRARPRPPRAPRGRRCSPTSASGRSRRSPPGCS
jgi:hypothetical protein